MSLPSKSIAYTRTKDGKLMRAQVSTAKTFAELIATTKEHFGSERALVRVATETLPQA